MKIQIFNQIWKRFQGLARWKQIGIILGLVFFIVIIAQIIPHRILIATGPVMKGMFIIDLVTKGEIDALNSTNVSVPRMRRRMGFQIVDMAPEGTIVKKGDFLLQLDQSEAQQNVDEAMDDLTNAKAELESERANIASNMAQLKSQLEQEKYNYEQAALNLKMMEYEAEIKKQEYEIRMKKAEVALAQAAEKIESQKVIDKARLIKAELNVRQAESELKEDQNTLNALTIRAPIDGLVVYQEIWSGGQVKKVQIGDSPWRGMSVIKIPDLSVMQAITKVNEVDISQIEKGQNVLITVDALEGKQYYGSIRRVATLARRENKTNIKVFDVEVTIDSTDGQLRPGMTCECRIITARIPEAVFVPIQSVFEKEGKTVVYVMKPTGPKMQEVQVGPKSSDYIVIEDGVLHGEQVCLRDPTVSLETIGTQGEGAPVSKKKSDNTGGRDFPARVF